MAEAATVGISVGTLPIRYLSLPLTTKSLTAQDYEPLIDKIRSRLLSYSPKMLSYTGRLQLIKSVITSITYLWSSAFILPKTCHETIENMCSVFYGLARQMIVIRLKCPGTICVIQRLKGA